MTAPKQTVPKQTAQRQNATSLREADGSGWAPRLAQEARLRQLDKLLLHRRSDGDAIDTEIERAVLLGALDRRQDAQQAFIEILRRVPTHFSALNEFGTLLTNMGAIDAACRVYSEAITHHPDNPMGHVNLANLLLKTSEHARARMHYETALRIDPEHRGAHQGLVHLTGKKLPPDPEKWGEVVQAGVKIAPELSWVETTVQNAAFWEKK